MSVATVNLSTSPSPIAATDILSAGYAATSIGDDVGPGVVGACVGNALPAPPPQAQHMSLEENSESS